MKRTPSPRPLRVRGIAALALIALLTFSTLPVLADSSLPTQSQAKDYVTNLIADYNALVFVNDSHRTNFASIQANLTLYEPPGHSFLVTVIEQLADAPTVTGDPDYLALIFTPVLGNQTEVNLDYNSTVSAAGLPSYSAAQHDLLTNGLFQNDTGTVHYALVWLVASSEITTNDQTNANNAAQYIHNADESRISVSNARTINTASTQISSATNNATINQSSPDHFGTIGIAVLLAGVILAAIGYVRRKEVGEWWHKAVGK